MKVTLKLYGNLLKYLPNPPARAQIEIAAGTTVRSLLFQLGVPDADVWMCAVNDNVVAETTRLSDGDVIEVFEPIGGGSG